MRKNHHGKNDRLVKRVFALCLALAVICTCLVPVFATEDLSDLQVEKGASQPVDGEGGKEEAAGSDGDSPAVDDSEAAGSDGDSPAVDDSEAAGPDGDSPAVDDSEAAGSDGDSPAVDDSEAAGSDGDSPAVDDSEAAGSDGDSPAVDDSEAAGPDGDSPAVDDSEAAGPDGEETSQPVDGEGGEDNPGEDDVVEKLQDMVVYRFWLKELDALDLQEIAMQAQTDNMTESEYLAQKGEVWKLYFIQAVPRAETIANYSSHIKNPSSNQDPEGMLRLFDHWYTLDELGDQVRLDLSDPTSNILDDETTTVNVYAAWKDGTVSSDEEEDVVHEDLVDKNPAPPAPVELTATAAATYKGEGDNTENVNPLVKVENLPSAADHLSVSRMSHDDMGSFYESHSNDFRSMAPLLGLKISPKNTNGETVQPAKGDVATVTVSGLNELSAMKGATANTLEVLHETSDGNVEILDVLTYTNGTLTFETSSFSPFVVALKGGYDVETLQNEENREYTIIAGGTQFVSVNSIKKDGFEFYCQQSDITVTVKRGSGYTISVDKSVPAGRYIVNVKYKVGRDSYTDIITLGVNRWSEDARVYFLYNPDGVVGSNDMDFWAGEVFSGTNRAKVDTTNAIWVAGTNGSENTIDNVVSYIVSWPDGSTGKTWTLPDNVKTSTVKHSGVSYTLQELVFQQYQKVLEDMGLKDSGITASDLTIVLEPYKISQNNRENESPDKHLDCNIIIRCEKAFTARFYVKDPGAQTYRPVSSKTYLNDMAVKMFEDTSTVPSDKTVDGVKYVFDGWYKETSTSAENGEDTDSTDKVSEEEWQRRGQRETIGYLPNEAELTNRVVAFYAHYTPVSANLTVSKTVTGMLGDTNKAFNFTITKADGASANITNANIEISEADSTKAEWKGEGKFTLKNGASITFKNLPSGEYKIVEDDYIGEKYETSYVVDSGDSQSKREAAVTVSGTNITLAFTNHCTLIPDTGVLLDTLPYIVILAVVAGGVALLMLRKRRKEDD